jgi:hypothetical protein
MITIVHKNICCNLDGRIRERNGGRELNGAVDADNPFVRKCLENSFVASVSSGKYSISSIHITLSNEPSGCGTFVISLTLSRLPWDHVPILCAGLSPLP